MINQSDIYNENFYNNQAMGSYNSATVVISVLERLGIKPKSVFDLGCGVGTWLKAFKDNDNETLILGVDANLIKDEHLWVPRSNILIADFEEEVPKGIEGPFDLAVCLECLEHISQENSIKLVSFLCQLSDTILFSAAIPGQTGENHINCHPLSFWVKVFNERGYDCFDLVRPELLNKSEFVEPWYLQNILIFCKKETKNYEKLEINAPAIKNPTMFYHDFFVSKIVSQSENKINDLENKMKDLYKQLDDIKKIFFNEKLDSINKKIDVLGQSLTQSKSIQLNSRDIFDKRISILENLFIKNHESKLKKIENKIIDTQSTCNKINNKLNLIGASLTQSKEIMLFSRKQILFDVNELRNKVNEVENVLQEDLSKNIFTRIKRIIRNNP